MALPGQAIDWRSPANLRIVGAKSGLEKEYLLCGFGQPGGLFYPNELVTLTLLAPAKPIAPITGGSLLTVGIHNRVATADETGYVIVSEAPRVARTAQPEVRTPLDGCTQAGGKLTVTLTVPKEYGVYAVLLERQDGTRTAIGSVARVHRPTPRKDAIPQMQAEFNFDGSYSAWTSPELADEIGAVGERLGYTMMRVEIHWSQPDRNGPYDFRAIDYFIAGMEKHGIKVMDTTGIHPTWTRSLDLYGVCEEQYDPEFAKWIQAFTLRYWKGGKVGLWGIEFYNEPWEPSGISGWRQDSVRYRKLLQVIHDNAKAVAPGIKILGTSSIMNTEDKLIGNGLADYVNLLDILTDHYVTSRAAYGARVAEKYGKISGETETWGCSTEVLIPQFMTQFLACGNRFINPTTGDMVMDVANTPGGMTSMPKPPAVAISAWNAIIADRPFNRIAFTKHLPWLYQFGPDNDAAFVLYGKLQANASGDPRDVVWSQAAAGPDGVMTLTDAKSALVVLDAAGNPVARKTKTTFQLPMSRSAFYLSSPLGAGYVIDCVRLCHLEGLRQLEIIPGTLTARPAAGKPVLLPVTLHNLNNMPVTGKLTVRSLLDNDAVGTEQTVSLAAGETTTVHVAVTYVLAGGLPLQFTVTANGMPQTWREVVQCTAVPKMSLPVDGDAQAWNRVTPVTVLRTEGVAVANSIEKAWLPFIKGSLEVLPAKRGDVRLAWDERNLYIQATVDAAQLNPKARLETRDDNQYYYSAADDATCDGLRKYERFVVPAPRNQAEVDALATLKADPEWPLYQQYLKEHPEASALLNNEFWSVWRYFDAKRRGLNQSFSLQNHTYKSSFFGDLPFSGDSFQFAFDLDAADRRAQSTHDLVYPWEKLPENYQAIPDSDYEFALSLCTDGKPELWCLLAPGIPRSHYYPRSLRAITDQHAVKSATVSIKYENGKTTYRLALPWQELAVTRPAPGLNLGFTFRFNDSKGGAVTFGGELAATKTNNLTLHPYWEDKPSCSVRWVLQP